MLTGIIPALVAWGLGFVFKYVTGVSIPGFGVVVLALAIAGVNGGLLALTDQTVTRQATGPVVVVAILVVLMMFLYARAKGGRDGGDVTRNTSRSRSSASGPSRPTWSNSSAAAVRSGCRSLAG